MSDCSHPSCVGRIDLLQKRAVPDFIRICARRSVRRVMQFGYGNGAFDLTEMLSMMGVECESMNVPVQTRADSICRAALKMTRQWIRRRKNTLPDLIFFIDDYVAQGALMAFSIEGLRIPQDVKIVVCVNRGRELALPIPLTRLEMDPVADGRAIAEAIAAYVRTGVFPHGIELGSVYKTGETF